MEYKFRVWDYDEKKMYYQDDLIITFDKVGEDVYVYKNGTVEPLYNYEILQYTGLKDENGVGIYEGDIIKSISNRYGINQKLLYVRWDRGQYDVFDVHDKDDWMDALYNHMNFYDVEVVGSIYENSISLEV